VTRRLTWLFLLVVAACTEDATSAGVCPNFCPSDSISIKDTIFTAIIERDSSFRGYVPGYASEAMTATDVPGVVESRPFFTIDTMFTRVAPKSGDTTTVPIIADSARLRLVIVRRDKAATNLRLRLYQLPVTADSTSTFASLDSYFNGPVVDSVNVSDLRAQPAIGDTATIRIWGDSIRRDSSGHVLQIQTDSSLVIFFTLDTLQAPFSVPDTGRLAYGVRVAADSLASVSLASSESGANGPTFRWFYSYTIHDTSGVKPDSVVHADRPVRLRFDGFVFNPPTPPLDSHLAVGGVPSARAVLRVKMPAFLHDTIDVVRATVILVPVNAVPGARSDSFQILARPVLTDLGAKSPLGSAANLFGNTVVHIGSPDTVRIELTNLVRAWSADTTLATTFFLGHVPEATSYTEIRFYSSRAPAFRPGLHVTYVKRFRFGNP